MSPKRAILIPALVLAIFGGCVEATEPDEIDLEEDECDEVAMTPPLPGDACETNGITCGFADECSSCTYRCSGGTWSRSCTDECAETDGGGE